MPTYGGKWRANSSACDLGHVPRSHSTPLLRLDSTGEISSVGHSSLGDRTQIGCTPTTEVNGNIVNMKNWVTNRVVGCNGLTSANNLTGSRTTTNINTTDFNANLMNTVRDTMQGSVANTMNERYPNPKFIQPQCGLSGWNLSGRAFGAVSAGAFAVFPCHQFSNSFSPPPSAFGHQGKIDMFNNPVMSSARFWSQSQMLEDQHWHQRHRKYDRSYRGHSPKHHKHEHVKHEKKSVLSEDVPSKCKRTQPKGVHDSVSEVCKPSEECSGLKSAPFSESKDVQFTPVDISDKCSSQVKSNQPVSSSLIANNTVPDVCDNNISVGMNGAQELNVPEKMTRTLQAECKESRKKNGVCDTAKELNQMVTLNITNTGECQDKKIENSSDEKSASGDTDQCKQESNIHVLLIRKNWKKGRPSASKQRRRKLQKAKSASSCSGLDSATVCATVDMVDGDSSDDADNKTVSSEDDKKSRCSATVSFILGLTHSPTSPDMPNGSSASSSFVFSLSDDESDEADDCEWDSDFNIEADFSHSNLLNFLPNNDVTTSPLNFKVHFSSLQNGPDTQDKTMEDINTSWNVQISVKEDSCRKKKKPAKKVHFPEEKDLSVVHPMVAWSFAYQAARKGHWENFVRDRDRFRRRIKDAESVLVPVLDSNHRNTVYMKRFEETENGH